MRCCPGTLKNTAICWLVILFTLTHQGTVAQDATGAERSSESPETETAIFAGGCFWCMEPPFDKLAGVSSTTSGYTGGGVDNPTYDQVSAGGTGHAEAVRIVYDPAQVSYETLLDVFWHNIDPLDAGGQFCDRGSQYRSAIFYTDKQQAALARSSLKQVQSQLQAKGLKGEISTTIVPAMDFFPAETYHQDYYQKNSIRYRFYRFTCGRDNRLEEVWE